MGNTLYITEAELRQAPTRQDYRDTVNLFDDFLVPHFVIPKFDSLRELLAYRAEVIYAAL